MSAECTSYHTAEKVFVDVFSCPKTGNDARAVFCCGFNDIKYCCDDPDSFFPYEYGYMWWLRYVLFTRNVRPCVASTALLCALKRSFNVAQPFEHL